MSRDALLILEHCNPLNNVRLSAITCVELVRGEYKIKYVDDCGQQQVKTHKATDYLRKQIEGFEIEVYN